MEHWGMFYKSEAKEMSVNNFNTTIVMDISYIFANSQVETLDLSNFDMRDTGGRELEGMLFRAAIKRGYAGSVTEKKSLNELIYEERGDVQPAFSIKTEP